ncbi:hypothetical protein R3P38DRAFT_3317322 [Favolaschia claudopus]|uniref:Integrase core domain-containing protein n=1 Tax=Favolaschia claudopus TaxID=2862362 RepID=A0AAW0BBK4_9AGAR
MSQLPQSFPLLPDLPLGYDRWSANVLASHQALTELYEHALAVTEQEDLDASRAAHHIDALTSDGKLLLVTLGESEHSDETPVAISWLHSAAELLGNVVYALRRAKALAQGREDTKIEFPVLVQDIRTGKRGRPPKAMNLAFVAEALRPERQIKLTELADLLNCHRTTLWRHMKKHGLSRTYADLSNNELDELVKGFKREKPESGLRYLMGFLRSRGFRVQRRRAMYSLRRVDNLGRVLRQRAILKRKVYNVTRPNALWHLDGHHKMIRWGIVLHGLADGYCRTVTGVRASNNNTSDTVLDVFLTAAGIYGFPSRMRGDRGGENVAVAIYMVMRNGPNRASFIWGSSTRNTRIERLWVEVGTQFVRRWRGFFARLERLHCLDVGKPEHLWLLHTLFLEAINKDCLEFQTQWNAHPMDGKETFNKSPNDLRLIGKAKYGIYRDDCGSLHPETIEKYYGVRGKERIRRTSGAGNPPDKEDEGEGDEDEDEDKDEDEDDMLEDRIRADQDPQIRHEAIEVPNHRNPFNQDPEMERKFFDTLADVVTQDVVPEGYGVLPEEWEAEAYPDVEVLAAGRTMKKKIAVSLAHPIWLERAKFWAQGLAVLSHFMDETL